MSTQTANENFRCIQKLPYVKQLLKENEKLKRKTKELKRLVRLISNNLPLFEANCECKRKGATVYSEDDDEIEIVAAPYSNLVEIIDVDENLPVPPVKIKKEKDNIKLVIVEEEAAEEEEVVAEEEEEVVAEEEEEVVAEEEEEEEAAEEEEEEEEVVAEEEEEEEAAEEEEEEEVVAEEEEEEEAAEEEGGANDEGAEAPAEEGGDEEVYEVIIKGKTYYTSNEKSGVIYGVDENGDVSLEVGVYKDGKPIFK